MTDRSDRTIVQCPRCSRKLGIPASVVGQRIRCPECSAVLATRTPGSSAEADSAPPSAERGPQQRRTSRSAKQATPPQTRKRSARTARKPAPVEEIQDFDDPADFDDDEWFDYNDEHDSGDDWLDQDPDAPWTSSTTETSSAKTRSGTKTTQKKKKKRRSREPGNVVIWLGAAMLAGLVSMVVTILVGNTGVMFLVYACSILTGCLIGLSIRLTAGSTQGWGPGIAAVMIAMPVIIIGRCGAYFVSPQIDEIPLLNALSPDELRRITESRYSEEGVLEQIIDFELNYDEEWKTEVGLSDMELTSEAQQQHLKDRQAELEAAGSLLDIPPEKNDLPIPDRYRPEAWEEARRRWNEVPEEERIYRMDSGRLNDLINIGLATEEETARLILLETSDRAIVKSLAYELTAMDHTEDGGSGQIDFGVTQEELVQFENQQLQRSEVTTEIHPAVLKEARRRWEEMSDVQKTEKKAEMERRVRETRELSQTVAATGRGFAAGVKVAKALGWALLSLFRPLPSLLMTWSSVFAAFHLGANWQKD